MFQKPNSRRRLKNSVNSVLLVIIFILMFFPLINTLNEFLVRIVEPLAFLKPVQTFLIPYEVGLVRGVLNLFSIPVRPGSPGAISITIITKQSLEIPIVVVWGCIGWQSLLIVLATLISGLGGKFTFLSKLEVLIVGLAGTFLLNISRITAIFVFYYFFGSGVAMSFHDYGSIVLTIVWLFFLWWYSFTFVLIPKDVES